MMPQDATAAPPKQGGREQGPTVDQLAAAVALLADDRESDEAIAKALGISRRPLARWKRHPLYGPMRMAVLVHFRLLLEREWDATWRAREAETRQAAAARPAGKRRR